MTKLSEGDSWRLFCVHAFGQCNIPPGVEGLARSVVEECQGLPLALKVIGGVMIGKKWPGEWERELKKLQESRMKHQDVEKQLFDCLKTSYDDLKNADHRNAKECFLYFAAFREDELLEQNRLLQYWVAEGLVPGEVGDDPEQDTYHVLALLIGRSLIELESDTENKLCCKIHRVLRDLAFYIIQSHAADEKKQLALYKPGCHLQEFPPQWRTHTEESLAVQRLSLNDNNLKTLPTNISAPNMHTLLLSHNEELEDLPNGFLKGIRQNLKVLDLSFNKSLKAFPRGFNNLKHLIYLHLGNCQGLKKLPESIGELTNLKNLHLGFGSFTKLPGSLGGLKMLVVLDLGNCANLHRLPRSIGKLEMLVTLNLFQCSALNNLPVEFRSLKRLESLNLLGCGTFHIFTQIHILDRLPSLRNLKIDAHNFLSSGLFCPLRSLVIHKSSDPKLVTLQSQKGLEDLTLHTGVIKDFDSHSKSSFHPSFLNLKTLRLSFLPNLQNLALNDCPNLVNLTLNDCPTLECVELTNCPNLVCLPALDSLPRLGSLFLRLSIKELPRSFTRRGAFPTLKLFDLRHSGLAEFPEVEEGAMPKLQWLDFDDCIFLHTLPASISLLISIQTVNLGSRNEKLMTSCKTNFRNSTIWGAFVADGKLLIPEEEVSESVVPMQEDMTTVRGSDKRPFQKVDGDNEERLFKRGGSKLGSDFFVPSSPKRSVYLGSSSMAETTKSEKEHELREVL
ncbi:unnamed protein product [Sphagnum tenellum]